MIKTETVRDYFSNHLLGSVFFESGSETMDAAVSMAENDIRSLLSAPADESSKSYIAAVCEQALFLLTNKDQLTENRTLVSESVEGLGSRSYSIPESGYSGYLAPRARLFIDDLNTMGTINLSRG